MTESGVTAPTLGQAPLLQVVVPAEACDGDVCEIPAHHQQLIMNRRLDDDRV